MPAAGSEETRLVLTSQAQREADREAEAAGIPSETLMESAGRSAAELILERADFQRPLAIAGRGGNGGDALVVARVLFESGTDVTALGLCRPEDLSPTTALMARRLEEAAPGRLQFLAKDLGPLEELLLECDGVIDGLFGSGLDRPLAGREIEAVRLINAADCETVSLDLPSGLASDQGALLGEAVEADLTIAMEFLKPAHLFFPARSFCERSRWQGSPTRRKSSRASSRSPAFSLRMAPRPSFPRGGPTATRGPSATSSSWPALLG